MREKQNVTEYKLTLAEEKLLEVLLNPQYRMKTVTDVCNIAEIERVTYYRAFAKPEFVEIYKQKSMEIVKQQIAPVLNAFVMEAKRGSYQHGKVLLEMAGLYTEKQEVNQNIGNKDNKPFEVNIKVVD